MTYIDGVQCYYKATDIHGQSIMDHKTLWVVGEITKLKPKSRRGTAIGHAGLLHAATNPVDAVYSTGCYWPWRIFAVMPRSSLITQEKSNIVGSWAWKVIAEESPEIAFGIYGKRLAKFIEAVANLSAKDVIDIQSRCHGFDQPDNYSTFFQPTYHSYSTEYFLLKNAINNALPNVSPVLHKICEETAERIRLQGDIGVATNNMWKDTIGLDVNSL